MIPQCNSRNSNVAVQEHRPIAAVTLRPPAQRGPLLPQRSLLLPVASWDAPGMPPSTRSGELYPHPPSVSDAISPRRLQSLSRPAAADLPPTLPSSSSVDTESQGRRLRPSVLGAFHYCQQILPGHTIVLLRTRELGTVKCSPHILFLPPPATGRHQNLRH